MRRSGQPPEFDPLDDPEHVLHIHSKLKRAMAAAETQEQLIERLQRELAAKDAALATERAGRGQEAERARQAEAKLVLRRWEHYAKSPKSTMTCWFDNVPFYEQVNIDYLDSTYTHSGGTDPETLAEIVCTTETQVCPSSISISLSIFDESLEGSQEEEETPTQNPDVVAHGTSRPLLPYKVKAIPDNFEQSMFVFKYGVLAKWHAAPHDEVEISLPTPPFCCGGDAQTNQPMERKRYDDEVCKFPLYIPLCMPAGAQKDGWKELWSIHSGRFKLLHMMPPDDIPRFPPPEEPPDPPIPPDKDEPG